MTRFPPRCIWLLPLLHCSLCFLPPASAQSEPSSADEPISQTQSPPLTTDEAADDDWGEVEEIAVDDASITPYTQQNTWYAEAFPVFDRSLNLLTGRTARPKSFVFSIVHRTNAAFSDDPFETFLGFDGGALKIGLDLRYGIIRGLDAGISRLNGTVENFDTYTWDIRWQGLTQKEHGVDGALRIGLSWFAQARGGDALKPFGQILLSRVFAHRFLVGTGLLYHSDSSYETKSEAATEWSMAAQALVDIRLHEKVAISLEGAYTLAGYRARNEAGNSWPTFSIGPKVITNRHTFAVVLSNTQYFTPDGIVSNSPRGGDDLIVGFNISRELGS